ncbi:MAG: UDP-N-acetylmuramate dehydrogenase [Acidiferrobacteraceae bacterium]
MNAGISKARMRGVLHHDEPMSRHTTWRTGGRADELYIPTDIDELGVFLGRLPPGHPLVWIGLGSNVLIRDGGIRGTVILTTGLRQIVVKDNGRVFAEAGVPSARVARASVHTGIAGAEFLAGIPGTVGGALAMNAGAFGGETWNIVEQVESIDRSGRRILRPPSDFVIGYRSVQPPAEEWFVSATFRLMPGAGPAGRLRIREMLARRAATQPIQWPNAGSVFRNPPDHHAARLIESAGLKGAREGRASVSSVHANFIVNEGGATSAEIETLIERVRAGVLMAHGVLLSTEVRILGVNE